MRFIFELNQFITITEFFHWFKLKRSSKYWFAISTISLLIFPNSDSHGFSHWQGVFVLKFVLWSFSVMNAEFLVVHSILSCNLILFAICFASKLMESSKRNDKSQWRCPLIIFCILLVNVDTCLLFYLLA